MVLEAKKKKRNAFFFKYNKVNSENYNLLTVKIRITGISFILLAVAISSSEENFNVKDKYCEGDQKLENQLHPSPNFGQF